MQDQEDHVKIEILQKGSVSKPPVDRRRTKGQKLNRNQLTQLLKIAPPFSFSEKTPAQKPPMPDKASPPPRPGQEQDLSDLFGSASSQQEAFEPPMEPVTVIQHSPDGAIQTTRQILIRFSQPMIALSSLDQIPEIDFVTMEPEIEGSSWRWMDIQTLAIEFKEDLPGSTLFKVDVQGGGQSVFNNSTTPFHFSFETETLKLENSLHTSGKEDLDPILGMVFSQAVDPDTIINHVVIQAGDQAIAARAIPVEEIKSHPQTKSLFEKIWPAKKSVFFKPIKTLPVGTKIQVELPPGSWSSEGRLPTDKPLSFGFQTHGPLELIDIRCGYGNQCPPNYPWSLRFSNQLDETTISPESILVEPSIEGMQVYATGNHITIQGSKLANTLYQIQLPDSVRDIYGGKLESSHKLSMTTGDETPRLFAPWSQKLTTLNIHEKHEIRAYSRGLSSLKAEVYKVSPKDFPTYQARYMNIAYPRGKAIPPSLPGELLFSGTIKPNRKAGSDISILDLTPYFEKGKSLAGQFIVHFFVENQEKTHRVPHLLSWIQFSDLGVKIAQDMDQIEFQPYSLSTGEKLSNVQIKSLNFPLQMQTPSHSSLILSRDQHPSFKGESMWSAQSGQDVLVFQVSQMHQAAKNQILWYLSTDRGIYKPNETVHLFGVLRLQENSPQGDLSQGKLSEATVTWALVDSRGNDIEKGSTKLGEFAEFDLDFNLPEDIALGNARVEFSIENMSSMTGYKTSSIFQVQEFKTPEFEVTTQVSNHGPWFLGDDLQFTAQANYYAGGGLASSPVRWQLHANETRYSPPGWSGFRFGPLSPWWRYFDLDMEEVLKSQEGMTDVSGSTEIDFRLTSASKPIPFSLQCEASVQDLNHQSWTGKSQILVHPSSLYVGVKLEHTFLSGDSHLKGRFVVCDLDGNPEKGHTVVVSLNKFHSFDDESDNPVLLSKTLKSAQDPTEFSLDLTKAGSFTLELEVRDEKGRLNRTQVPVWFFAKQPRTGEFAQSSELQLIPEKTSYEPGETVHLLVQAPFQNGWGTLSLCRSGLIKQLEFSIQNSQARLSFPIEEGYMPNLGLLVHAQETAAGGDSNGIPQTAEAHANLDIVTQSRQLLVTVDPDEPYYQPGASGTIQVRVNRQNGTALADSPVAVMIVDEAVLALDGFELPEPLTVFYPTRPDWTHFQDSRSALFEPTSDESEDSVDLDDSVQERAYSDAEPRMMMKSSMPMVEQAAQTPRLRKDFVSNLLFKAFLHTDGDGSLEVPFSLKDNLTRFRIMVFSMDHDHSFGKGSSNFTVRLPLIVRPAAPSFVNIGDRFMFPVTLQNQTGAAIDVKVLLQGQNLRFSEPAALDEAHPDQKEVASLVVVPAGDRVNLEFPARPENPGSAHFQVMALATSASGKPLSDAVRGEFPVQIPGTREAMATYGELDSDSPQALLIQKPGDIYPGSGKLDLEWTDTQLHTLGDAYLYLRNYEFDCTEQLGSKIISFLTLKNLIQDFNFEEDQNEDLGTVQSTVNKLLNSQLANGGFGFWSGSREAWPFTTLHAVHALIRAKQAGLNVPVSSIDKAFKAIETLNEKNSKNYSESINLTSKAYELYLRHLAGQNVAGDIEDLLSSPRETNLPLDAYCWLLSSMDPSFGKNYLQPLINQIVQTASTAEPASRDDYYSYFLLGSRTRTHALALNAMAHLVPQDSLTTKLVRGLLGTRRQGRWSNTQENLWALIALQTYQQARETTSPNCMVTTWINEVPTCQAKFRGREDKWSHVSIPVETLEEENHLLMAKDGEGLIYYRIGLDYVPASLQLEAENRGFEVIRSYEALDHEEDVRQAEDGSWHIRAGSRVRVKIKFSQISSRQHVALMDPLPAGLQIINPELNVSSSAPIANKKRGWPWLFGFWFDHQERRQDRMQVFSSRIPSGSLTYSYIAQAVTRGDFTAAPTHVEEMYQPDTFGRSASDSVFIE